MRNLLLVIALAVTVVGQTAQPPARQAPPQGPPPKISKLPDGTWTANRAPTSVENFEVHTVKPGDTLSAIAAQYLQNLRLWPQLWEANEHIVNPHWIYPDDKILMPGCIDSTTNFVEHPRLIAQRICNVADIVGRERVIAGTDCGFATFAAQQNAVAPSIAWAKLAALADGARIASDRLWRR